MAENFLPNRSDKGRTFTIIMWVIGVVFAFQALLVASAFLVRPDQKVILAGSRSFHESSRKGGGVDRISEPSTNNEDLSIPEYPLGNGNGGRMTGIETPGETVAVTSGLPEPLEQEPAAEASEVNLSDLNIVLARARATAPPIQDTILARLVDTGEELRISGNMQGALQALAKAEAAFPEHPRILSQMAAIYEEMGVNQTASEYWAEVEALGVAASGPYYDIASRIRSREPLIERESFPAATGVESRSENASVLSIGEVKVDEQPPGESGQRVSLRIVVDSLDGKSHFGEDLSLFVFFYDLVDGDQILESTADTSYLYPTEPYDWKTNGKEQFIVNYDQPRFSPEEVLELGERRYYGYAIQLYYRDLLQDTVVMPAEISKLRLKSPASPVLPGGATPERVGPENALFPENSDF